MFAIVLWMPCSCWTVTTKCSISTVIIVLVSRKSPLEDQANFVVLTGLVYCRIVSDIRLEAPDLPTGSLANGRVVIRISIPERQIMLFVNIVIN